ncbi:MAG: T9SS type A sorting domain-containing protein [Bacteroidetes bacterium]|nr:T9SS type A sorting domain-containing protein [Bacteroidota bacterium]
MRNFIFSSALALTINCLLLINNCSSQWVNLSGGISGTPTILSFNVHKNNLYAGVYNYPSGVSGVYISTNMGLNWSSTSLNMLYVGSLASFQDFLFAGVFYPSTNTGGVYVTSDEGANWALTSLNLGTYSLAVIGHTIFAGVINNGVFLSDNFGQTWTLSSLDNVHVLCFTSQGQNIFAGTAEGRGLYVSTNGGYNWHQTSLSSQTVFALTSTNDAVFASTQEQGILVSTDGGNNWIQSPLSRYVYAFASYGANAFAGTENGGVYLSSDAGASWSAINTGFGQTPLVMSLFIANKYIFAGTGRLAIWRRPLSDVILDAGNTGNNPSSYFLGQNYPNPFNPVTKIQFAVKKNVWTIVKVYDILGKEVTTLVNERLQSGTYEVTLDGSGLNSGVYFYRLTAGDYTETKKMLLVK